MFQIPENFLIQRQYDSHTHWQYTGEVASLPSLRELRDPKQISQLHFPEQYRRKEWIYAFGWDHSHFKNGWPNRFYLDELFPETPVLFSRIDGHSSWVNTAALKKLNLWKSKAEFMTAPNWSSLENQIRFDLKSDSCVESVSASNPLVSTENELWPSGILHEDLHMKALYSLPAYTPEQIRAHLLLAQDLYLQAGFTHIRDMTTSEDVFVQARQLETEQKLKLFVETNVVAESVSDLNRALELAVRQRSMKSDRIRVNGIKIFVDGSLGSETAFANYANGAGGQCLWLNNDITFAIESAWKNKMEISVHAIGDLAADLVVDCARVVSSKGLSGRINLEHAQVLQSKTIQKMKSLHIRVHMQPCHFLSDHVWLKNRLGAQFSKAFPWRDLSAAKVPISFGSDSPIEPTSLINNLKGLMLAESAKIQMPMGEILQYHSHPDSGWGAGCETNWQNQKVIQIQFEKSVVI